MKHTAMLDILIAGPATISMLAWELGVCAHLVRLYVLDCQIEGYDIEIGSGEIVYLNL